ncbi:jg21996, partial [Pararge aegeria aegeria]
SINWIPGIGVWAVLNIHENCGLSAPLQLDRIRKMTQMECQSVSQHGTNELA